MKHHLVISRGAPAKAFFYQLSLTQKIMELATLASFADSAFGAIKNLFPRQG